MTESQRKANDPSPLMAPRQVEHALAISRDTLNAWTANGTLTAIRLPSGHRRYRRDDVEAIARGEVSA